MTVATSLSLALANEGPLPAVDPAERDGLLAAFLDAARAGDMAGLIDLLIGGRHERPAAPKPMITLTAG